MTPPEFKPQRPHAASRFTDHGTPTGRSLTDFWSWTASDLLSNSLRGQLAEYIVGSAMDCIGPDDVRLEWNAYDLSVDDIRIEVKSTAFLQSWGPTTPGSMKFGIGDALAWDARTNTWSTQRRRSADVYVFCVHIATDRSSANPLELNQWRFYVVPTATLDAQLPHQRSISLSALPAKTGATPCTYGALATAIRDAIRCPRAKR